MKITFLGTGTSQGVPVIGCECEVCQSTDARDNRLRTSAMVETGNNRFIIDAGPDFRQQLLRAKVEDVTAILITHEHNDHIIGMDDVRPLNFKHSKSMPIYAEERVQLELKERFAYIFSDSPYPGAPRLTLNNIDETAPINIEGTEIHPIRAMHGNLPILGYRFGDFAYLTDIKTIEEKELSKLNDLKILAIDALHHSQHHSHLNLEEALDLIKKIGPEKAYLIHISHRMGLLKKVAQQLPDNVQLSYDGLVVSI